MFWFVVLVGIALWWLFRWTGKDQPVQGCVFVTGCDSGA